MWTCCLREKSRSTIKSTRSLVVLWTCSLQLKTMRFRGQNYGSYGAKPWHFWCVSMGVWASLWLRSTTVNGQQTTDLWAVADCSPLSVDCSLPKKTKLRRCRPLLTPVSPVFPLIGEYLRGILKGWSYAGADKSSRLRGFAFGFAGQRTIGFEQ